MVARHSGCFFGYCVTRVIRVVSRVLLRCSGWFLGRCYAGVFWVVARALLGCFRVVPLVFWVVSMCESK